MFCPKAQKPPVEEKKRIDDFAENHVKKQKEHLPKPEKRFNYITDVYYKWRGVRFYLVAKYACPGPNALSPSFEDKFAKLECFGDGKYALYAERHNGEWMPIVYNKSLNECLNEMTGNPWFQIH